MGDGRRNCASASNPRVRRVLIQERQAGSRACPHIAAAGAFVLALRIVAIVVAALGIMIIGRIHRLLIGSLAMDRGCMGFGLRDFTSAELPIRRCGPTSQGNGQAEQHDCDEPN